MKAHLYLTQSMIPKEVVNKADHRVCSLPCVRSLINEVVHLPWNALTAYAEDATLASRLEVHGPRLKRIVGVMDLLGEVEGEVDTNRSTTRRYY